jgi:hypothetical protein
MVAMGARALATPASRARDACVARKKIAVGVPRDAGA